MAQYFCTDHALDRLHQRYPHLAACFPRQGAEEIGRSRRRLSSWAHGARPTGIQRGDDLLLCATIAGTDLYFAVRPFPGGRRADTWTICTVLTPSMAEASIIQARRDLRAKGLARRRDRRCAERLRRLRYGPSLTVSAKVSVESRDAKLSLSWVA